MTNKIKDINSSEIIVSVDMITYNHEKYIAQAIEGVLMQKTKFRYELVIGEDCSTDSTRSICLEYKNKFPDIIKLRLPEKNLGMQQNGLENALACSGKYIAICEGDDYWIDPFKLQKQVDFLEANANFGVVHSDCNCYFEKKKQWEYNANKKQTNNIPIADRKDIFYRLIDATYKICTATAVFRKDLLDRIIPDNMTFLMGDTPMWLNFSQLTNFKYFDEVFAVYRIVGESASRSKNKNKLFRFSLSMAEMRVYYSKKFSYPINDALKKRYNNALLTYKIFNNNYKEYYPLFEPSIYQRFKLNALNGNVLLQLFLIEFIISNYLLLIKNRLRSFKLTNRTSIH